MCWCRKIAGLERLLLNADAGWRPATARSMDLDDLPSATNPPSPTSSLVTGSRRHCAVTQSMPAFNRSLVQRASSANGAVDCTSDAVSITPGRSRQMAVPCTILEDRPTTAAPDRRNRPAVTNPRAMASPNNLDCFLSPDIRAGLSHLQVDSIHEQPTLSTTPVRMGPSVAASGRKGDAADPGAPSADDPAVQALKQEYRNVKFAGPTGGDSVHIRLARLEMQLRALQVCVP
jgi:hypothetical protein